MTGQFLVVWSTAIINLPNKNLSPRFYVETSNIHRILVIEVNLLKEDDFHLVFEVGNSNLAKV